MTQHIENSHSIDLIVRERIAAAGITPDEEEIQSAITAFPGLQQTLDRLYSVDLPHEEDLAVTFFA